MNKRQSPFLALKFKYFRLLFLGLLISRIGSEMQVVAVNWQTYLMTGSPLSLGIIGLARFLPILIFSLAGGITADKFSRKNIMLTAQIAMTITSLVLTVATFSGMISPGIIYLMIAASSAASAFDTPARQSIIPLLVPKKYFMNAVSLNTIMWQSAIVIGPTLAGFTIAYLGVANVYLINSISFLAVITTLILISIPHRAKTSAVTFSIQSIAEGLTFVRKTPIIYSTMLLDFFATFFSSATVLLPIFAKDILRVGPEGLGLLYAAPSLGAISAGLILSTVSQLKNQGKILLGSVILYGLATIFFGLSRSFYLSLFFIFFTGVGDVISTIIRNTIRQLATPDRIRGRMVSVNMIFFMGGPQLGEAEAGIVAAALGTPQSVIIGGMGTIVMTFILAVFIPKLRKYQGHEIITA